MSPTCTCAPAFKINIQNYDSDSDVFENGDIIQKNMMRWKEWGGGGSAISEAHVEACTGEGESDRKMALRIRERTVSGESYWESGVLGRGVTVLTETNAL